MPGTGADNDPLGYTLGREQAFVAAAARGHAHVIYAKSPGGARASAARVARYRPLVEAAATTAEIDPDTLEAIVLLESAGRPDAAADPRLEGAVGLTQILAETGRNLLGMNVDPAAARRIGRSLRRAARKRDDALIARLRERRRRIDERFDPPKALAATARYLLIARRELGRADLAVQSYHMGIGNVQSALRDYGEDDISYARLYFDSTPLKHADAYRRLASLGDDSSTYLCCVGSAREIMRLYRSDPAQLQRISQLQTDEELRRGGPPPGGLPPDRFATPDDLRAAYDDDRLLTLPRTDPLERAWRATPAWASSHAAVGRARELYRGLAAARAGAARIHRPQASERAPRGSARRHEHGPRPAIPAAARARNREATPNYSLHTTGWRFEISRSSRSRGQALAFEFLLERLQSHDLIAWVREPGAIHVTVSADAGVLARVVAP